MVNPDLKPLLGTLGQQRYAEIEAPKDQAGRVAGRNGGAGAPR